MAYSMRDDRQRTSRDRLSRSRSSSGSRRARQARPTTQEGPQSRRGTLTRPDTGYTLHSRRVRRDPRGNNGLAVLLRPRVLLLLFIVILVVVVLIVGITSCVRRNNDAASQSIEEVKPKNEQDERVAAGVSANMTSRFTEALDNNDLLASIAANADQYDDDRLLLLALREPSALAFVNAYPSSDKSSRPYGDEVTRGEVPSLYNWDEHWGAVTYGDGPLAVTGSGPTTLAMAYMGLTGKTDFTPTEIAQQASKSNYAGNDSGSKPELFSKLVSSMGLASNQYEPSAETLLYSLGENTVFAVELKEGTLTDEAHWALVVNINADGSVTVFDPTSTEVSSRPWDMGTITAASNTFFAISPSEQTLASLDTDETDGQDQGASSDTTPIEDGSYEDESYEDYDYDYDSEY